MTAGILVPQVIDALPFAMLAILAPAEHSGSGSPPLRHTLFAAGRTKPTLRLASAEALASPHAHGAHPEKSHDGTAKPHRPSPAGCRAAGRSPKSARPRRRAVAASTAIYAASSSGTVRDSSRRKRNSGTGNHGQLQSSK